MCPACGTTSARVHSRYVRRLADSAVGGRPVVIELRVRRSRCRQGACRRCHVVEYLTVCRGRWGPWSGRACEASTAVVSPSRR
ncbi:transposase family protein [Streptomyces sp. NPDC085927]|uniref:transposase family protein n=1 Tax=Streptomyces sp. NPDC085927 TaxID=3365738 RepID=UPI0037D2973C